jgi:hypothetical protein
VVALVVASVETVARAAATVVAVAAATAAVKPRRASS